MIKALVLGGGFSGAMTAVQLAARGVEVVVVEPGALGRGVAYAEGPEALVLNTPAAAMSALPDRPDDFVVWLAARGDHCMFASRALYGAYVREKLARIAQVTARAVDVAPWGTGYVVACRDGTLHEAAHVVLALGNAPPRTPRFLRGFGAYHADPYRALVELPVGDHAIALLGTGLTALDVVAALRVRGHTGAIHAISRRGLVPHRHPGVPAASVVAPPVTTTLAGLLAWWRGDDDATAKLDAIRRMLPMIWRGWDASERARFVRHVRPHWETVRHRAPPEVHAHAASIDVIAGRLTGAEMIPDGLRVHARSSALDPITLDVAALVNCTGPERDLTRIADPLVQQLLRRGLVEADPMGLGASALAPRLHCVGPWRIATDWESTAVGELRAQAAEVAEAISAESEVVPSAVAAIR